MTDVERRRDTHQAAAFLTEHGFKTAPAYLTKLRCVGGGPEFEVYGRKPLYRDRNLLNWALARTRGPVRSSSELSAEQTVSPREDTSGMEAA
jgi:hypothetical protein